MLPLHYKMVRFARAGFEISDLTVLYRCADNVTINCNSSCQQGPAVALGERAEFLEQHRQFVILLAMPTIHVDRPCVFGSPFWRMTGTSPRILADHFFLPSYYHKFVTDGRVATSAS